MALTRKMLAAMGIEEPQMEQIIEAHAETVTALKAKIADAEERADGVDELKQQLEKAKGESNGGGNEELQAEIERLKSEHDEYVKKVESESANREKGEQYKSILRELGIDEKRIDTVMKVTDVTGFEIDGDTLKDADKLKDAAKEEWADFIPKVDTKGADTPTPPSGGGESDLSKLSDDEALKLMRERGY